MKALAARRTAEGLLLIREEVGEPARGRDDQALVAIEHAVLEAGALDPRDPRVEGRVVGRGFAGRVIAAAADGSGPGTGERVIGIAPRGSARERLAICARALVCVPDTLELEEAALLPVPGLGAYHALKRVGFAFGKRLTVFGAATATGQLACQLGLVSGMRVTALVELERNRRAVSSHGVESVDTWFEHGANARSSEGSLELVDLVVDASGGRCPPHPSIRLTDDGACVNVSVDELGDVSPSEAMAHLGDDPRGAQVLVAGGATADDVEASALALTRLVSALAAGDIVLPLPSDVADGEVRLPRRVRCIPLGHLPD